MFLRNGKKGGEKEWVGYEIVQLGSAENSEENDIDVDVFRLIPAVFIVRLFAFLAFAWRGKSMSTH